MRVAVVGAGAVGSLLGGTLAQAGHEVTLVRRRHAGPPDRSGLTIRRPDGERLTLPVTIVADSADAAPPELIVLAVKMPDLEAALAACAGWPEASVLAAENGIGADAAIVAARPRAGLVAGALTAAVDLAPDGELQWRSWGGIGLASVQGAVEQTLAALAAGFEAAGLRTRRFPDPEAMRWSKLVGNLLANSISAIVDLDAAAVYDDPALYRLELRQLREALAVMRCLGLRPVRLPGADVAALALLLSFPDALSRPILRHVVAGARGGKSPSLQRHVRERGGPSEAPWLNGAVAAAGERCGTPAPVNARLGLLVEAVATDPEQRAWFRARPDRLVEAMADAPEGRGPA